MYKSETNKSNKSSISPDKRNPSKVIKKSQEYLRNAFQQEFWPIVYEIMIEKEELFEKSV
jgi:hypothetical protein